MAKLAREIVTDGMTVELHKWDSQTNDYAVLGVQLCGHQKLTFADGTTPQTDTTDYCQAATGYKSSISGAKENGTLTVTLIRFDPKQDGQKLWADAEVDTKFKLVATYPSNDKMTIQVQKKKGTAWEHSVGTILAGTIEMATISDAVWA